MPIGIKTLNDFAFKKSFFAFKKSFSTVKNKVALISLPNAILDLPFLIVDVSIENPYNLQDFLDDKFSILDIKAIDENRAVYSVEMQLAIHDGLVQRVKGIPSGDTYRLLSQGCVIGKRCRVKDNTGRYFAFNLLPAIFH